MFWIAVINLVQILVKFVGEFFLPFPFFFFDVLGNEESESFWVARLKTTPLRSS